MPTLPLIDRSVLVREIDDLVAAHTAAQAAGVAWTEAQAAEEAARAATVTAEVASRVADGLLAAQIAYIKELLDGDLGGEDPTPGLGGGGAG